MRRHVRGMMVFLFTVLSLGIVGLWSASFWSVLAVEGTADTVLHRIIAVRGQLSWWRVEHWWRVEEWRAAPDAEVYSKPIEDWPGIFVEKHSSGFGFESASGKWKSPPVKIARGDKILLKMPMPVGSMFSTLVPFHLMGAPLWAVLLVSLLLLALFFRIWRRSRALQLGK